MDASARIQQGNALYQQGRFEEAVHAYTQALSLAPDAAEALHNRVAALFQLKRWHDAHVAVNEAIAQLPGMAELYTLRGSIAQECGALEDAAASYTQAIALKPALLTAHQHLASALFELKRFDEALIRVGAAIALNPNFAEAHHLRGNILFALGQFDAARSSLDRAVTLAPGSATAQADYGNVLQRLGQYQPALACYQRAVALQPHYPEGYCNLGVALDAVGEPEAALAAYDAALAQDANFARAWFNKANNLLAAGDFAEGWKLYEWRWRQSEQGGARAFTQPLWLGEGDIRGKTILLHAEQGLGDTIQFCRLARLVETRGARVILEVQPPLVPLLRTLDGNHVLIAQGEPLPAFDLHTPLMSLPLALGLTLETVPAPVPYLFVPEEKRVAWAARLGAKTRMRVGVAWSGAAKHKNDHHRSMTLAQLAPLFDLDAEFHAVQKEVRAGDAPEHYPLHLHTDALVDFADTAALVEAMDMVVSVDTSAAHLAGALGKPCALLLPFTAEYRWLRGRADSPWYPSLTLFRQPAIGDWQSVILAVSSRLREKL